MTGTPVLLALVACVSLCLCCVHGLRPDEGPAEDDEITLERMQIFVNFENRTTFNLMVEPDYAVQDLWIDINTLEGIPYDRMNLKIGDTRLHYGMQIADHNIRNGTTLSLVVPEEPGHLATKFIVRTRDGREQPVTASLSETVAQLKDVITLMTGIPQVEQRLLIKGKELRDDRKLVQYEFYNGAMVELGRPLEDCRKAATIFVKTMSGAKVAIEVDLADTANSLKDKIWDKTGVPVGVQRLFVDYGVIIAGEDHLCDLGLQAGSTVSMVLYSTRITSLDQVAKLQEPSVARRMINSAIFHEAEDVSEPSVSRRRPAASLYKDARNWVTESGSTRAAGLFDPVARLEPNPDDEESMQRKHEALDYFSRSNASELEHLKAVITRAQIKLSSMIKPYRVAANLSSVADPKRQPGITLSGRGSIEVSPEQVVTLRADINNWAPDAFSDSDVLRLFEVSERVRRVLARDAQTGEGTLGIASQKQINAAILTSYLEALAGCPPFVEYNQTREGEQCGICQDDLTVEPAIKLACEHTFHADCIQTWATNLWQESRFPSCPFCRQPFMLPYSTRGKVELEASELKLDF